MRLLMNSLDPDVADSSIYPIVRSPACYEKMVETLRRLEGDETLLVQSGKPVGVFQTHPDAPRLLIAQSNLVGKWANWNEFRRLEELDLMMYSQMGSASWIQIGVQASLQAAYELFSACARKEFQGDLRGRFLLSGGLGNSGGALPLAATLLGAVFLGVDVDRKRIERCLELGTIDRMSESLQESIDLLLAAKREMRPLSIGLVGNISQILPQMVEGGIFPDLVTDQCAAHDLRNGYIPAGLSLQDAEAIRQSDPSGYEERVLDSMVAHVEGLLEMKRHGVRVFDYGNNLRGQVADHRHMGHAFEIPGFISEYLRPLFCRGIGPLSWVALSGNPADIAATEQAVLAHLSYDERVTHWIRQMRKRLAFQGLPARVCWFDPIEKVEIGERFNWLVKEGLVDAPIAIGHDQIDGGSITSPNQETEGLRDGTDGVADWPMLTALLNSACGASWVSIYQGGGVGLGYSQHSGLVCIVDGSESSRQRIERVMRCDGAASVMRHADAGYPAAVELALRSQLDFPMITDTEELP